MKSEMNSAQRCPVCHAAPNKPCTMFRTVDAKFHHQRLDAEHGTWMQIYDEKHRLLPDGKPFRPRLLMRSFAARRLLMSRRAVKREDARLDPKKRGPKPMEVAA